MVMHKSFKGDYMKIGTFYASLWFNFFPYFSLHRDFIDFHLQQINKHIFKVIYIYTINKINYSRYKYLLNFWINRRQIYFQ